MRADKLVSNAPKSQAVRATRQGLKKKPPGPIEATDELANQRDPRVWDVQGAGFRPRCSSPIDRELELGFVGGEKIWIFSDIVCAILGRDFWYWEKRDERRGDEMRGLAVEQLARRCHGKGVIAAWRAF